jgi:hypothetical protein
VAAIICRCAVANTPSGYVCNPHCLVVVLVLVVLVVVVLRVALQHAMR